MEVWAEAMRTLSQADESTDLNLVLKVLNGNSTIPVIVLDRNGAVLMSRNVRIKGDTTKILAARAAKMRADGNTMKIALSSTNDSISEDFIEICYAPSLMLKRLSCYPYVQLGVVLIFVVIAIFALLSSKKAEQNKVWVGLSKETAHQLGTPISSLMAWVEILKENYPQESLLPELDKDVTRLQLVVERFSKIGSIPELKQENVSLMLQKVTDYMAHRTSEQVCIQCVLPDAPLLAKINTSLFEWVIENLCKNAVDAMTGKGTISITAWEDTGRVYIEVADTGKGISKNHFGSVFTPGFTTKKRGWGLGLSLAKRIIEEYHKGRIFVKKSEIGKGTTFRIEVAK